MVETSGVSDLFRLLDNRGDGQLEPPVVYGINCPVRRSREV